MIHHPSPGATPPLYFHSPNASDRSCAPFTTRGDDRSQPYLNIDAGAVVSSGTQTFQPGMYVLTVEAEEKVFSEKFVVGH